MTTNGEYLEVYKGWIINPGIIMPAQGIHDFNVYLTRDDIQKDEPEYRGDSLDDARRWIDKQERILEEREALFGASIRESGGWRQMVLYLNTHGEISRVGTYVDELFEAAEKAEEKNVRSWEKATLYYFRVSTEEATNQEVNWLFGFLRKHIGRAAELSDERAAQRLRETFGYAPDRSFKIVAIDTFFSYVHKYEEGVLSGFAITRVVGWKPTQESDAAQAITSVVKVLEG